MGCREQHKSPLLQGPPLRRPWAALGTALGAAPLRRPPVVRRRAVHYEKARKFRKARRFCPETILMPTSLIDSAVFRDIFSTAAMRQVFSDENRVQKYLDFEAALARAQGRLGIIPKEAEEGIVKHCNVAEIDFAKLKTQTEKIGYRVLPVVQHLVALCRDGLGEWCHWGATTQDITDSATVMQIREALVLVEADLNGIAEALAGLARKYRDTPMAGR